VIVKILVMYLHMFSIKPRCFSQARTPADTRYSDTRVKSVHENCAKYLCCWVV
jgi:hypothetical protein